MVQASQPTMSAFTIGRTLIAVISLLAITTLGFATFEMAGTLKRSQDASRIVESTNVSDLLLTSAGNWAVERGITNSAIGTPDPISADRTSRIETRRQTADEAYRAAVEKIRSNPGFAGRDEILQKVNRAFENVVDLRRRVDTTLQLPRADRDAAVVSSFVPTMTDLIMLSQELRLRADYQPASIETTIASLRNFRHDVWVMSEYAGRERAIVGGLIGSGSQMTTESLETLARFRGHLVEAWTRVQVFVASGRASEKVVAEVRDVEKTFFGTYESVRNSVYSSGTKGSDYPISSTDWIATSTAAIDQLLDLSSVASEEARSVASAEQSNSSFRLAWESILVVLCLLVAAFSFWVIIGRVIRPINAISKTMIQLASGKLDVEVPGVGRRDEIGEMASSVQVFKENGIEAEQLREERKAEEARAAERELAARRQLADAFETSVGGVIDALTSAATELNATAESMSSIATETNNQSTSVASASEQASVSVQTVAAAAEELSKSIAEIAAQVERSTESARAAVEGVTNAENRTETLRSAAEEIGVVLDMISEIADQTNLLALNATIEAARAGEAGKGFAVVAQEVKSLAKQTGDATGKIAGLVSRIRSETSGTQEAIHNVRELVSQIDEVANSIAAAIEEQNASTSEISRNVTEASVGASEVSRAIVSVRSAAGEAGSAANQVVDASNDLSSQAGNLKREVANFLERVRAA